VEVGKGVVSSVVEEVRVSEVGVGMVNEVVVGEESEVVVEVEVRVEESAEVGRGRQVVVETYGLVKVVVSVVVGGEVTEEGVVGSEEREGVGVEKVALVGG
jgi:hypothetical protein